MKTKRHPSLGWRARLLRRLTIILSHIVFRGILRTKVEIRGQEFVPKTGAIMIAPNHRSLADAPFFWEAIPRPHAFIGATEAFQTPVIGWLMRHLGHIEVVRGNRTSGASAQQVAADLLRQGGAVGICPEGGCSADGVLMPFKNGVARLAILTQSDIVPLAIVGAERILPMTIDGKEILEVPWYRWFRFRQTVIVQFGPPISPAGFTVEELTGHLRQELLALIAHIEPGDDAMPVAA